LIFVTLLFAATFAVSDIEMRLMFEAWKIQYEKSYFDATEEAYRFGVWSNMYHYIQGWNAAENTATLGLNAFSDLTGEEFKSLYTNPLLAQQAPQDIEASCPTPAKTQQSSFNWATNTSIVTPVKNQGQCGSCWAFAAVAVSESLYALNGNKLTSFSEQQVVSCDKQSEGCNGGYPDLALNYIASNGLETESEYPYTATTGTCKYTKSKAIQTGVTGYCNVQPKSVQSLNNAIAQQPTVVVVEADQAAWQSYNGGVITSNCGVNLDHAVTATGFTSTYFIIKNSWGTSWGNKGYVYVGNSATANKGAGVCGVLSAPVYAAGLQ
jgi:C1A family cysteine protease